MGTQTHDLASPPNTTNTRHRSEPFLGARPKHTRETHFSNNISIKITHYYTPLKRKRRSIQEEALEG